MEDPDQFYSSHTAKTIHSALAKAVEYVGERGIPCQVRPEFDDPILATRFHQGESIAFHFGRPRHNGPPEDLVIECEGPKPDGSLEHAWRMSNGKRGILRIPHETKHIVEDWAKLDDDVTKLAREAMGV